MNARNFDKLMCEQIENAGSGKKLLLHCCCAPCSSACLERLFGKFEICALFYNPNIEDAEYLKRKAELIRFLNETGYATVLDCDHNTSLFYDAVKGLEKEKEGGARCRECFTLRLKKTAEVAEAEGFDYFSTTLTLSPLKDAERINAIGCELEKKYGVKWLFNDFKKANGYLRSLELSKEHDLYRQNYCGCVFSQNPLD
ncbi:MAG: epoxyqueuosine reductase QueH [Clostridia bacterium]|nr:epoxyqueuosine reductase QueH [Clostridia bacterium]